MAYSNEKKCVIKITALVALLQGLTWLSLCIVTLVTIQSPPEYLTKSEYSTYTAYLSFIIYQQFLTDVTSSTSFVRGDKIIGHKSFVGILWMYIVLSAFWIGASIDQYSAIKRNKKRQINLSIILGVIILITSIIDIICTSLLARDFSYCDGEGEDQSNLTEELVICKLSVGIVMTLVARGFVLLLLNTVMSLVLIIFGVKELHAPSLMTYSQSIPRVPAQNKNTSDKRAMNSSTESFFDDQFNASYPNSNSYRYNSPPALEKIRDSNNYY